MEKIDGKVKIIVALIGLIGIVVSAIIGAKWGKNNVSVTVNIDGKSVTLKDNDIQNIADENEEFKNKISDYERQIGELEKQIDDLDSERKELSDKLGVANGEIDDFPTIEYKNYGLSIDGEEKSISKDKSSVLINGRQYYSKDFVDNLLPDNKTTIEKEDMLYVGKVVKEKSNLFDRQMINRTEVSDVHIETNVKDTYGNIHDKGVTFVRESGITYNANREYSKLKCTITVLDGKEGGGVIQIESEQGVLYTSQEILSTTEPVKIDIPINQASKITIKQISGVWTYNMVADAVLYNEE